MYIFFSILIVIAALLLIGVVLIQKSKGGGLASDYSGANQMMGYRKTTDVIEKITWGLAIFICVCSILSSYVAPHGTVKSNIQPAQTQQTTGTPAPASQPQKQAPAGQSEAPAQTPAPAQK